MGKALYRAHRSTSFDELIGQSHITDTLKTAVATQQISHAYLFTGPRGTGKTSVARILAHEINGLPYTDAVHLDIIEIDAASNRRIDEIRELRDKVHIAPVSARYKVYIIDEVHMLTREAFNALLKTLEEPPEHAVFILATTELHKVPDTIVSRTQKYTFKPLSEDVITAHLRTIADKESITIADEALQLIAVHGRGSFRDSIGMLDQLSGLQKDAYTPEDVRLLLGLPDDDAVSQLLTAVAESNIPDLFASVQVLKDQGADVSRATRSISESLRDSLLAGTARIPHASAITLLKNLLPLTTGHPDYTAVELACLEIMNPASTDTVRPAAPTTPQQPPRTPETQHTAENPTKGNASKKPNDPESTPHTTSAKAGTAHSDPEPEVAVEPEPKPESVDTTEDPPAEKPTPKPPSSDSGAVETDATVQPESTPAQAPVSNVALEEAWPTLIADVKQHHNTLYGVLRMAQPTQDSDGNVMLQFGFAFHKKRIDSDKNKSLLLPFFKQHLGVKTFKTSVSDQKSDQKPPMQTQPASPTAPPPPAAQAPTQPQPSASGTASPKSDKLEAISNIFGAAELLD